MNEYTVMPCGLTYGELRANLRNAWADYRNNPSEETLAAYDNAFRALMREQSEYLGIAR